MVREIRHECFLLYNCLIHSEYQPYKVKQKQKKRLKILTNDAFIGYFRRMLLNLN